MTVVDILQLGNPILRQKSEHVEEPTSEEVERLRKDLTDTFRYCRETTGYGRGIAAPQIGVLKRVIFINMDHPWLLVNPEITERSKEEIIVYDFCLSYLCIFFKVLRSKEIKVSYQEQDGRRRTIEATNDLSQLLQHEIDHLDGILAIDRITDTKSIYTKEEYEKKYGIHEGSVII